MPDISRVHAREVLDSRGNPTVEVEVHADGGPLGRAMVPSGASTGEKEALELRDNNPDRFRGKGVLRAVETINDTLHHELTGMDLLDQRILDRFLIQLDGTEDKSSCGANALLGVSLAVARAGARAQGVPLYRYLGGPDAHVLPTPFMNVVNGGEHADNQLDVQEFMIVPAGASRYRQALQWGVEVFHELKRLLAAEGYTTTVGDEGGFAPSFSTNQEALDWLLRAVGEAGYEPGQDVVLALDVAASELCSDDRYHFEGEDRRFDTPALIDYYQDLVDEYPIVSIEDGCDENDWEGWDQLTGRLGEHVQLVGDDLFVTNPDLLRRGIEEGVANSILIKVNQIGTLTETLETIREAHRNQYTAMVSHRSGETEDTTIADLAVAKNTGQIKTGSLSRGERTAKYNQLLRIEEELGDAGRYSGFDTLPRAAS